MRLIITKVLNKVMFISALGRIYPSLSLKERTSIVNALPYNDNIFLPEEELKKYLDNVAEYSYQNILKDAADWWDPPFENQDYLDARAWYKSLPKEDQKKIDVLKV